MAGTPRGCLIWEDTACRVDFRTRIAYDLKHGQLVQEGDQREAVLLPAGDGLGGRQTEDGLRAVSGVGGRHREGDGRRGGRDDAAADRSSGVRGRGRGVVAGHGLGRGRRDRRGGRGPPVRCGRLGRQVSGVGRAGRLVAPRSKKAFADWWAGTAADRFTRISGKVLEHRKFWDAMHAVDSAALQDISTRLAGRMIEVFDLDTSSVALDMTNFATYIDSANGRAPIAQRGKAKQKRTDLRLVGLGMVVTRAGGIPLAWHAYPGNRPDVTQFPTPVSYTHLRAHETDS